MDATEGRSDAKPLRILDSPIWSELSSTIAMKRKAVLDKLRMAAISHGLAIEVFELTRHTAVRIGSTTRTLGRHAEIDDLTARKFFDQFADELGGKGWWR